MKVNIGFAFNYGGHNLTKPLTFKEPKRGILAGLPAYQIIGAILRFGAGALSNTTWTFRSATVAHSKAATWIFYQLLPNFSFPFCYNQIASSVSTLLSRSVSHSRVVLSKRIFQACKLVLQRQLNFSFLSNSTELDILINFIQMHLVKLSSKHNQIK